MSRDIPLLPPDITEKYEIHEWRHSLAILYHDFRSEWENLIYVLRNFELPKSNILKRGGNKSVIAQNINGMFEKPKYLDGTECKDSWKEKNFDISFNVDGEIIHTQTHKVDYFKNRIAVETEWNSKDSVYDRDLNNFRLLHQLGIISLGIIITRSDELQEIFKELGKGDSYGESTTHMSKLLVKMNNGGSGGCPILAIGITKELYKPDK